MQDLYFVKVKFYSNGIRKEPPCIDKERYSWHKKNRELTPKELVNEIMIDCCYFCCVR